MGKEWLFWGFNLHWMQIYVISPEIRWSVPSPFIFTLVVDTFCEHLIWKIWVGTFCGHFLWTLFVNTFCEHFLKEIFKGHFLWTIFVYIFFGHNEIMINKNNYEKLNLFFLPRDTLFELPGSTDNFCLLKVLDSICFLFVYLHCIECLHALY